jgi:transposase, IS5 family
MRERIPQQPSLVPAAIKHEHADELRQMSAVLDGLPQAVALVHADLVRPGTKPDTGRKGMAAEQVLRALVIKQMNGFSYEELSFHLADSNSYRWFCRLGIGTVAPKKSTLQKAIKRIRSETWEAINRMIVEYAAKHGVETGEKVRADCTVVESNIHHPTDSSLLWDCVRVLARLMDDAHESFGINFSDHSRRAKRRAIGIANAKSDADRLPLYKDLLKVTDKTLGQVEPVVQKLKAVVTADLTMMLKAEAIAAQLRHYATLTGNVISQTERRVLRGESVPAAEKLVSIFEPHTDIIVKDRRETLYGHKICLTAGASGIVTDVVVEHGNPADSTLAVRMVERHRDVFGSVPNQVAFDGGFASRDNLAALKELGVKDVAFSKGRGLGITEMVKSSWVYRRLRDFRAGIEGVISFLKRGFDLTRCRWSGLPSFKAYVAASVLSCNLLIVARHLLDAAG